MQQTIFNLQCALKSQFEKRIVSSYHEMHDDFINCVFSFRDFLKTAKSMQRGLNVDSNVSTT